MMKKTILILAMFMLILTACSSYETADAEVTVYDTGVNPDDWALIPAGEFFMGLNAHETMLDYDYEIMVTTVTNAQFTAYFNDALTDGAIEMDDSGVVVYYAGDEFHAHKHEERIDAGNWPVYPLDALGYRIEFDGNYFSTVAGYENHPVTSVTWFGANAYCEYYDFRLPTEAEWEKAARGVDQRAYAWGDEIETNYANYYASHDPSEAVYGRQGDTTPVGFYNGETHAGYETFNAVSPYGLYDMGGNVWQWTDSVYKGEHYRYLRGGSKGTYEYNLRVWTRNSVTPTHSSISVGFRCVRDQ